MVQLIATTIFGSLISIMGIINMSGNISSLHWYHRQRVTEENRRPFGKLVGLGTLMIGISMIIFGSLLFSFEKTQLSILITIGTIVLILGIVAGLALSIYAMIKYNHGIF